MTRMLESRLPQIVKGCGGGVTENTYILLSNIKIFNEDGKIDNFRALARKLSFVST